MTIIAAIGANNELGKDNDLCWRISEDLRNFRNLTMGKYIIMGEKTYLSLPKTGLPGRKMMVLSPNLTLKDAQIFRNLDDFLDFAQSCGEEIFVCGGGIVYKLLMPHCNKMIITHIDAIDPAATVFFPEIDMSVWRVTHTQDFTENGLTYSRSEYKIAD